jgi:hypothetical protein
MKHFLRGRFSWGQWIRRDRRAKRAFPAVEMLSGLRQNPDYELGLGLFRDDSF